MSTVLLEQVAREVQNDEFFLSYENGSSLFFLLAVAAAALHCGPSYGWWVFAACVRYMLYLFFTLAVLVLRPRQWKHIPTLLCYLFASLFLMVFGGTPYLLFIGVPLYICPAMLLPSIHGLFEWDVAFGLEFIMFAALVGGLGFFLMLCTTLCLLFRPDFGDRSAWPILQSKNRPYRVYAATLLLHNASYIAYAGSIALSSYCDILRVATMGPNVVHNKSGRSAKKKRSHWSFSSKSGASLWLRSAGLLCF